MSLTVSYTEDENASAHWSIKRNGVEIETIYGHYDSREVLSLAERHVDDELVLWMLHGDYGFLAVIDSDREPAPAETPEYYLGDGVYVRFDGMLLSLSSAGNTIIMDPRVLDNFLQYATTVRAQGGRWAP